MHAGKKTNKWVIADGNGRISGYMWHSVENTPIIMHTISLSQHILTLRKRVFLLCNNLYTIFQYCAVYQCIPYKGCEKMAISLQTKPYITRQPPANLTRRSWPAVHAARVTPVCLMSMRACCIVWIGSAYCTNRVFSTRGKRRSYNEAHAI